MLISKLQMSGVKMQHNELTQEGTQLVADAVREIATPAPRSWESIVASNGFLIYVLTRPPIASTRIPYLLNRSISAMVADMVILAICASCGLVAARDRRRRGRLVGAIIFVISTVLICDSVRLLLNSVGNPG